MGPLRVVAIGAAAVAVWMVSAAHVPHHERIPMSAIVARAALTQPFGCTTLQLEPVAAGCHSGHFHTGVDLAAPVGTAVHVAASGRARWGFDAGGAGLYVVVDGGDGTRVLYCHLSGVDVAEGESVTAGQVIGEVGTSGLATGPHLHLEVQIDGRPVDPAVWLAS
jgi:murein DD-endopeptidase MepM/ murein hydrolase activator NlpD